MQPCITKAQVDLVKRLSAGVGPKLSGLMLICLISVLTTLALVCGVLVTPL